jgi:hypothetical protein
VQSTGLDRTRLRIIRRRRKRRSATPFLHSPFFSEKYYMGIKNDPELRTKLTGNWEVTIGEQDTFIHILEFEEYDKTSQLLRTPTVGAHPFGIMWLWLKCQR